MASDTTPHMASDWLTRDCDSRRMVWLRVAILLLTIGLLAVVTYGASAPVQAQEEFDDEVFVNHQDEGTISYNVTNRSRTWTTSFSERMRGAGYSGEVQKVYVGDGSGTITELDASDGSQGWSNTVSSSQLRGVETQDRLDRVYVADADATRALYRDNGTQIWAQSESNSQWGVAVGTDNQIYSGGYDEQITAYHENGSLLWTAQLPDTVFSVDASQFDDTDRVYVGYRGGVRVFDNNGTQLWDTSTSSSGSVYSVKESSDGAYVYAADNNNGVFKIAADDGTVAWNTTGSSYRSLMPSPAGDGVFAGDDNGDLHRINSSGGEEWVDSIGASSLWDLTGVGDSTVQEGAAETSPDLYLDLSPYMRHNTTQQYKVIDYSEPVGSRNVTGETSVVSNDSTLVTVYESNRTLKSTKDTSRNERTTITATYNGSKTSRNVTVANSTVDNLDILPGWWRLNASLSDWTIRWIIIATLAAIGATRLSSAFSGIGAFVMVMVAGFVQGDVGTGLMIATAITGIFVGMNLALNIDTSIR